MEYQKSNGQPLRPTSCNAMRCDAIPCQARFGASSWYLNMPNALDDMGRDIICWSRRRTGGEGGSICTGKRNIYRDICRMNMFPVGGIASEVK